MVHTNGQKWLKVVHAMPKYTVSIIPQQWSIAIEATQMTLMNSLVPASNLIQSDTKTLTFHVVMSSKKTKLLMLGIYDFGDLLPSLITK